MKTVLASPGLVQPPPQLPNAPEYAIDIFGARVETVSEDSWDIYTRPRAGRIKWTDFDKLLSPTVIHALRLYTAHCIESLAPHSVITITTTIKSCVSLVGRRIETLQDLDAPFFEELRTKLRQIQRERRLKAVRPWYYWMVDRDLPGVDATLAERIRRWNLKEPIKGEAVMSLDPKDGPLSDLEFNQLLTSLKTLEAPARDKAAVWLCLELGSNALNLALLEERDLCRFDVPAGGQPMYQLEVPRIKKGQHSRLTKRRSISWQLGELLSALIEENHQKYREPDPERPIFCLEKDPRRSRDAKHDPLSRFKYHLASDGLTWLLRRFAKKAGIVSHRTGQLLQLTPRRLRYTFAVRLVRQGAPASVLAELLDHSDLSCVLVYLNSGPDVIKRLDMALGHYLDPLVRRFMGQVVEVEDSTKMPIFGDSPTLLNLGGLGKCNSTTWCDLNPPLACYVCPHFHAIRSGPHKQLLEEIENRQRKLDEIGGHNPSNRMPRQLDEVKVAIEEVIRECEKPRIVARQTKDRRAS
jgi:integrase